MISHYADIPSHICPSILPDYNFTMTRQYNNNGTSHYIIHLMLESDPAAMQALAIIKVSVSFYEPRFPAIHANQFVSYFVHTYIRIKIMHCSTTQVHTYTAMNLLEQFMCIHMYMHIKYIHMCICTRT